MSVNRKLNFEIYRYDPDKDERPYMQKVQIELREHDRMLLDVLVRLKNEIDDSISFRRSCREGICGSDAVNINGRNGLACITNLNTLPDTIVLRPIPGLPVVRDLIVDMTHFFDQFHSVMPYLINSTPPPERERLQSPAARRAQRLVRVYFMRLLFYRLSFFLVEPRQVCRPGRFATGLSLYCGFSRRCNGRALG